MNFIPEHIINENCTISEETDIMLLGKEHPVIMGYLFSETFHFFTEKEKDYFLYLGMVLIKSFKALHPEFRPLKKEFIAQAEEQNWVLLNESVGTKFRDRITIFFKDFPQEDLLAFVEDSLIPDENDDGFVSKEGRDLMFVGLKTILDGLINCV